jgi:hypothetical protein
VVGAAEFEPASSRSPDLMAVLWPVQRRRPPSRRGAACRIMVGGVASQVNWCRQQMNGEEPCGIKWLGSKPRGLSSDSLTAARPCPPRPGSPWETRTKGDRRSKCRGCLAAPVKRKLDTPAPKDSSVLTYVMHAHGSICRLHSMPVSMDRPHLIPLWCVVSIGVVSKRLS